MAREPDVGLYHSLRPVEVGTAPLGGHVGSRLGGARPGNGTNPARSRCRLARRSGRRRGPRMLSIPVALDALNFLSADVRNLFGPFINVFLVTSQHWTQTDVGLITTGSGLLGLALQTPIGAAIDVTHAKRAVIVGTMAAMTPVRDRHLRPSDLLADGAGDQRAGARRRRLRAGGRGADSGAGHQGGAGAPPRAEFRLQSCRQHRHRAGRRRRRISLHPARGLPARARVRGADRRRRPDDSGGRHRSRPGARPRQGRRRRRGPGLRDPLPHPAPDDLRWHARCSSTSPMRRSCRWSDRSLRCNSRGKPRR